MVDKKENDTIIVPRFDPKNGFKTTRERSALMSKIRSSNTSPELKFRKALAAAGVRYRVRNKDLPGNPDIANRARKFVVFIDGEFWHGYNWGEKKLKIKANRAFWIPKIERNIQRDNEANLQLQDLGYKVFRFWANDIKKDPDSCLDEVLTYLSVSK